MGTPLNVLMEWEVSELHYWYTESEKLHNKMNRTE
jgi:hypothetical protein